MGTIGGRFLFLGGLMLSITVEPERWAHVGGSPQSYEEYLDTHSVRRVGDKASAWTRRDFVAGSGTAWHEIEFDCLAKTETILSYVRDDGTTISHNVVRPHREAAPIERGSTEERASGIACR